LMEAKLRASWIEKSHIKEKAARSNTFSMM